MLSTPETLEIPVFWRNCHAEAGDRSGKSGFVYLALRQRLRNFSILALDLGILNL
jgi:hypothetical protein